MVCINAVSLVSVTRERFLMHAQAAFSGMDRCS
jgi:hypothetical protein